MKKICKVEDCEARKRCLGYCSKHYQRYRKHGNVHQVNRSYIRNVHIKHGKHSTPAYSSWQNMKTRCYFKGHASYCDYGGRGIKVCERWLDFQNFYEDMGDCLEGMSLGRIDNNKDYSPENCRWESTAAQAINKRLRKDNKSGIKGVCLDIQSMKWRTRINFGGQLVELGAFKRKSDAIKARREAEQKYFKPILAEGRIVS